MKKILQVFIIVALVCAVLGVVIKFAAPVAQSGNKKTYEVVGDVSNGILGDVSKLKAGSSVTVTLSAADGYALPEYVMVTGASYEYDRETGSLTLSNPVGKVSIEAICVPISHSISVALTNGSSTGATTILTDRTATVTLTADTGYTLPSTVTVSGATHAYDSTTGVVSLSNPTGNVTISGACAANTYTVSTTLTNGTYSGAQSVTTGGTATVTLAASSGYSLPSVITVSGATFSYDGTTGVVTLSNPTGNVTILASCVGNVYPISINLTNGDYSGSASVQTGSTATVTLTADTGYTLPSTVTVLGATHAYDSTTGVVSLSSPTGNVSISGDCVANTYTVSTTLTNGTYSGAQSVTTGGTATVTLAASSGYSLPSTVTVSGATYTYDSTTGVVSLSAPTGNVTISGACTANTYTVSTTFTNGTSSGASSITYGGTATVTLSSDTGYTLPSTVTVSGATHSYDSTTGVVSLSNPTGNVTISGACDQAAQGYSLNIRTDYDICNGSHYAYAVYVNDIKATADFVVEYTEDGRIINGVNDKNMFFGRGYTASTNEYAWCTYGSRQFSDVEDIYIEGYIDGNSGIDVNYIYTYGDVSYIFANAETVVQNGHTYYRYVLTGNLDIVLRVGADG